MAQLLDISTYSVHKSHNGYLHNDALASLVNGESSDIDSVLVLDRLD